MGLCIDLFQRDKPNADTRKDGAGARAGWQESEKTYLVLDQELDTLNGSSSSLGDGGRNTTHCYRRQHYHSTLVFAALPSPYPSLGIERTSDSGQAEQ
jgi:hypothetical protein